MIIEIDGYGYTHEFAATIHGIAYLGTTDQDFRFDREPKDVFKRAKRERKRRIKSGEFDERVF